MQGPSDFLKIMGIPTGMEFPGNGCNVERLIANFFFVPFNKVVLASIKLPIRKKEGEFTLAL